MEKEETIHTFTCGIDENKPTAISTNFKNFKDSKLSIQKISEALVRNGYRNSATGIAKVGNRIEIEMQNESDRWEILQKGLMYGNHMIQFRDSTIDILPVTMIGIPMNVTANGFLDVVKRYGNVHKHYEVVKDAGKFKIKNGNRVVHYTKLFEKLPEWIVVNGKNVKLVHKNQQKYYTHDLAKVIADANGNTSKKADAKERTKTDKTGSNTQQHTQAQVADGKGITPKRKSVAEQSQGGSKSIRIDDTSDEQSSTSSDEEDEPMETLVECAEKQHAEQKRHEQQQQAEKDVQKMFEIARKHNFRNQYVFVFWKNEMKKWMRAYPRKNLSKQEKDIIKESNLPELGKYVARTFSRYAPQGESIEELKKQIKQLHLTYRDQRKLRPEDIDLYAADSAEEQI